MFTNEEADEVELAKDPLAGLDMSFAVIWAVKNGMVKYLLRHWALHLKR